MEAMKADGTRYREAWAVVCLTTQLAATLEFAPALSAGVAALLPQAHTCTAGVAKLTVPQPRTCWRARGYSGLVYSHAGLIAELDDHSRW